MFASRYFANRYFAARFWPAFGAEAAVGIAGQVQAPVAAAPVAALWRQRNPVTPQFFATIEAAAADFAFLVEITAYQGGQVASQQVGVHAGGPVAAFPVASLWRSPPSIAGEIVIRASDRGWIGAPDDPDQPNAVYEGRVSVPLRIERSIPLLPEQGQRMLLQVGAVELINVDGQLDGPVAENPIDGRRIKVLLGPTTGSYADFGCIGDLTGVDWESDGDIARAVVRDAGYRLERPLQGTLYDGTGGADGGEDLEGKPRPLLYGLCRNVSPYLIDPTALIYQVHDGPISSIDAVYERGAAVAASGSDYADYTALAAASVTAGQFATALAVGMFRLGSSPDGLITADVRGAAAGGYVDTHGGIALRLLLDRALFPSEDLDAGSFAAWPGGTCGIYITEPVTTAAALDVLARSCDGWWGQRRGRQIKLGRLGDPAGRPTVRVLTPLNLLSLTPQRLPLPPRWRQRVAYRANWSIQRGEDIPGSVSDDRRLEIQQPHRVYTQAQSAVRQRHANAVDAEVLPTLFDGQSDAVALADRLMDLHSPERFMFLAEVKGIGFGIDLANAVRVEYPRFGLDSGRTMAVVGVADDAAAGRVTLALWG